MRAVFHSARISHCAAAVWGMVCLMLPVGMASAQAPATFPPPYGTAAPPTAYSNTPVQYPQTATPIDTAWAPFQAPPPRANYYPYAKNELTDQGPNHKYQFGAGVNTEYLPVAHQEELPPEEVKPLPMVEDEFGELILGMECSGCGAGGCGAGGCGGCIGGCQSCGRANTATTHFGRFYQGVYNSMCCPDPCYEPHWLPIADSAFFTEAPRPMTQTRLRWDAGFNVIRPDIGEFFWARADGAGLGPPPPAGQTGTSSVDYNEVKLYNEIAQGGFSVIMEFPYRSLDIDGAERTGGFSDIIVGTKSMMLDSELVQWSLVFKTYIPVGVPLQGLGTGHTSVEPAIVMAINLAPETYLQAEVAERIPIAGDPEYSGGVLHYHLSLNHTLARPLPSMPIIASMEANGYTFHEGAYTDPTLGTQLANKQTFLSIGPGIRCFICDRMDFGLGSAFAVTQEHLADYLIRSEVRMRF